MLAKNFSIAPKKRTILLNGIIVLLFVFALSRYRSFFEEVSVLIKATDWTILVHILLLSLGYFLLDSYVCYLICKTHNSNVAYKDCLQISYIVAFFRLLTLGSGGMPAKVYCYHKKGLEIGDATGVWLIQFLLYKIAVLLTGIGSILFFPEIVGNLPVNMSLVALFLLVSVMIIVLLLIIAVNRRFADFCTEKLSRLEFSNAKLREKAKDLLEQIQLLQYESGKIMRNKKLCLYICAVNMVMLLLYNIIPSIMIQGNSNLSVWYGVNAMGLTTLLSGAIPLPSGFGSVEIIYYALLAPLGLRTNAAGSLILLRFFTVILPFFIGGILWIPFSRVLSQERDPGDA